MPEAPQHKGDRLINEPLEDQLDTLILEAGKVLKSQVNSEAADVLTMCFQVAIKATHPGWDSESVLLTSEDVSRFASSSEQACLLSTVMEDGKGEKIREGLDVLGRLLKCELVFGGVRHMPSDTSR